MAHCHTDLHDHTAKLPFELLERIFAYLPDVISGSMPQWTHRDGIKMFTLARWMDDDLLTCNQAIRRVADLAGVAHQDACADWLPVTLVCRRWRAVALAQFGRTIPIPAHSGSLAVDSVLSGFAPLHTSLHIDEKRHYRDPATWKLYGSLLKSNLSRLRRIYISLASPVSTDEYTEVCAAHHTLLNKCNATQIQELYAVGANLAYYTFGSVVMARYGTPRRLVIPSTCFSSLKRIFLRRCVLADRSALCACRQLVSLVLDSCQDMWPDTADMLDTLCTLPYLRELHISGKTWPRDIAFDRDRKAIDLTCLTSVRLTGTIDQLVPFLSAVILHHSASLLLSCHILPWSWGGQSVESDAHPLAKVLSNHFACSKGRGDTFSRVAMDLSETEQNIVCTEPTTSSSAGLIPTTTFALSLRRDWLSLRESGYNTAQEAFAAVYRALPIEDREDGASDISAGISSRPGLRIHNADTPLNRGVRWWPFVARIRGLQQLTLSSETALPIARQLALSDTETLPHLRNIDIDVGSIKSDDIPLIGEALDATAGARRAACPVAVGRFNTRR